MMNKKYISTRIPITGTHITYNPELIAELERGYQKLIAMFKQLQLAFNADNYKLVQKKIRLFDMKLLNDVFINNVKLYISLDILTEESNSNSELFKSCYAELHDNVNKIKFFLHHYQAIANHPDLVQTFAEDIDAVCTILLTRQITNKMHKELYPIIKQAKLG